jgi:hypothetical protein
VTGAACRRAAGAGAAGFAVPLRTGCFLGVDPPAATPPVLLASAGAALVTTMAKLKKTTLRAGTRKTTTSFVGLRG